jgi:hypothetical protein
MEKSIWTKFGELGHSMRQGSNKPLMTTFKDSVIVTVVSLVITLIILFIYSWYVGDDIRLTVGSVVVQTVGVCMVSQFIYEYIGVNAMLQESSLRYAKGGPLKTFMTTRSANIYNVYNELSVGSGVRSNEMTINMQKLLLILDANLVYKVLRWLEKNSVRGVNIEEIANVAGCGVNDISLLLSLCDDSVTYLKGSQRLIEILDRDIIKYILLNGFCGFTLVGGGLTDELNPDVIVKAKKMALDDITRMMSGDKEMLVKEYGEEYEGILNKRVRDLNKLIKRLSK